MSDAKNIYLGRRGKSFGPFSRAEIEAMRLSGELEKYAFVWSPSENAWKTLETPPPPPGANPAPQAAARPSGYEAVCHDHTTLVSGALENVSEAGCDLVCLDSADSPRLGLKSMLLLNVLDNASQKAVNVQATLSEIVRREKAWVYRLRWARLPF